MDDLTPRQVEFMAAVRDYDRGPDSWLLFVNAGFTINDADSLAALGLIECRLKMGMPAARLKRQETAHHEAYFTHDAEAAGDLGEHLYYFAPARRQQPPYRTQRRVQAIIDVADDGTLAGVELIDDMPPPPPTPSVPGE